MEIFCFRNSIRLCLFVRLFVCLFLVCVGGGIVLFCFVSVFFHHGSIWQKIFYIGLHILSWIFLESETLPIMYNWRMQEEKRLLCYSMPKSVFLKAIIWFQVTRNNSLQIITMFVLSVSLSLFNVISTFVGLFNA